MPILLSSSRGSCTLIIGGSGERVHARICALHTPHTHTHKYIPSMFLGIDDANDSQMELFWLNCVDTLHKKRARWLHADSWLTWTWTRCFVWSTLAQTCLYFWFGVNLVWAPAGWGFNIPDPDVLSIMEMHSEVLRYRRLIVIQCCQTQFCFAPLTGSTSSQSTSTSNWPRIDFIIQRGSLNFSSIISFHDILSVIFISSMLLMDVVVSSFQRAASQKAPRTSIRWNQYSTSRYPDDGNWSQSQYCQKIKYLY